MKAQADTLWFFPEHLLGAMIFHATTEVQESDALDVSAAMVAYESSLASPRPYSHYQSVMNLRTDRETAVFHAFHDSQLCPPRPERLGPTGAEEQQAETQKAIDLAIEDFRIEHGGVLPADFEHPQAPPPLFPTPSRAELASGDFDLSEMVAGAKKVAENAQAEGKEKLARLDKELPECPPRAVDVEKEVEEALRLAKKQPSAQLLSLRKLSQSAPDLDSKAVDELLAQEHKLAAVAPPRPAKEAVNAIGSALAQFVNNILKEGGSLEGANLTGVHLKNVDLRGLNLCNVVFAYAKLEQVNLEGANLEGASFQNASLNSCCFRRTRLRSAQFRESALNDVDFVAAELMSSHWAGARIQDCDFSDADLSEAMLTQGELRQTAFQRAHLNQTILMEMKGADCLFREAKLQRVTFMKCEISGADFSHTEMHKVIFLSSAFRDCSMAEAWLTKVLLSGESAFPGASFRKSVARDCGFRGTELSESDFREATLSACDLAEACLDKARMDEALISRCGLKQVVAREASFRKTDFYQSRCAQADFEQSSFRDASLVGAELSGASWKDADLAGASPKPEVRG